MRSVSRILAIGAICSGLWACGSVVEPTSGGMGGTYTLVHVDAPRMLQGVGTVILTDKGYAERRIRYWNNDGSLSMEYLSRGEAELQPDQTVRITFREIVPASVNAWHPEVRLTPTGLELVRYGAADGTRIVETYRRQ